MTDFITALTTGLSNTNLWGAIAPVSGLIIVVALFALGKYVVNKNLKAISKGKSARV